MKIKTLSFLIISTLIVSCNDDEKTTKKQLIPLSSGNRWIYQDSIITETEKLAFMDTVEIISSRASHDTVWWKFTRPFNPLIDALEFMVHDEKIYSLQHTDAPGAQITGIIALEYVPAPDKGSLTYSSLYTGDVLLDKTVKKSNTKVTTPAGVFYSPYIYTYEIYPYSVTEVVSPDHGMISFEMKKIFDSSDPILRRKLTLIQYKLK